MATGIVEQGIGNSGNQVATPAENAAAPRQVIDMRRIAELGSRAEGMVSQIRQRLLAPESRKVSPEFSTAQLAALCGVDKAHVNYRLTKGDLPAGRGPPYRTARNGGCGRWAAGRGRHSLP